MVGAFLSTKINPPLPGRALLPRPLLIERLTECLDPGCRLGLISAPAGYGKTSLLCAWAAGCGCPAAWLSVDEWDNDPARFLAYLVLAVQKLEPGLGGDVLAYLRSPNPPGVDEIIPLWVNLLEGINQPFILVLDDYHLIRAPEIQRAVAFLLEHEPPSMHLVIATRKDPPLPIPRLRARGQLVELRQADLRFSGEETAAFLREGIGATLDPQDVSTLHSRTEGWAAGLQMAAISMQGQTDLSGKIAAFGASHEFIVDYFASEVLAQQGEPIKTFLLQTSILEQLCGPLCDALTGRKDGQATLESLRQANLFVMPLDRERCWYRYHRLFRDLLQKQLQRDQPASLPALHRRARVWFEARGMADQAIEHALLAEDPPAALRLVDEHAEPFFMNGEHVTLLRWLGALPEDELSQRPRLQFFQAVMLSAAGKSVEAARVLQLVDRALAHLDPRDPQQRLILGRAAAVHAVAASLQDDPQIILTYANRALEFLPAEEIGWRSSVLLARSYASYLLGDPASSVQGLSLSIEQAKATSSHLLVLMEIPMLAESYWVQGQLNRAAEACQAGFQYMEHTGLSHAPMCDHLYITWGVMCLERDDLEQAAAAIRRGLELSRNGRAITNQVLGHQAMLRVCLVQGDLPGARASLAAAEALFQEHKIPVKYQSEIIEMRARMLIREGQWETAKNGLQAQGVAPGGEIRSSNHALYLLLVRIWIAQGEFDSAEDLLNRLAQFYPSVHCLRWMISVQILRARLSLARGDKPLALVALASASALAGPEGFIQDFLEEGAALGALLQEAVRVQLRPAEAQALLARLSQGQAHPAAQSAPITAELVEPLSERELEVLGLVAQGLSNQAIAARLYVTLRTVKFHTGNIYGKLGVTSRTEAVSHARTLGIL
jgi:LuxR family transcriptional regulator, maltose regulon positive regulatory protein